MSSSRAALLVAVSDVASGDYFVRELNRRIEKTAAEATPGPISRGVGYVGGNVLGAPFRAVGEGVASVFLGPKNRFGPMRGTRLRPVAGGPGKGLEEISAAEYSKHLHGGGKGEVLTGVVGDKPIFYRRKYSKGGLVGMAQRNPKMTAALAGIAYLLGTNQRARDIASGMMPGAPEGGINPVSQRATDYAQYQPSGVDPLTKETWG